MLQGFVLFVESDLNPLRIINIYIHEPIQICHNNIRDM